MNDRVEGDRVAQGKAVRKNTVRPEQRMFSLVLALVASSEGLTKRELLSSVYGYADKYRVGDPNSTLERQFERDKDLLRSLGIHIDTIDSPLESGNNQLTRYRIAKDQLEFPRDLEFTGRELMLLRLAALAWREGSLTAEARRATMKLEALGAGLDIRHLGIAPSFGVPEPAGAPLQSAIAAGSVVTFSYAVPGRELQRSAVSPRCACIVPMDVGMSSPGTSTVMPAGCFCSRVFAPM